MLNKKVN